MRVQVQGTNTKKYRKDVYVSETENIITVRPKFRAQRYSVSFLIQPF